MKAQVVSFTLSLTSVLYGGGWSKSTPRPLYPGKGTRYPLYKRLSGPQDRSRLVREISPPPRFDHRTVQPVASCYIGYAILAHNFVQRKSGVQHILPKHGTSKTKFLFAKVNSYWNKLQVSSLSVLAVCISWRCSKLLKYSSAQRGITEVAGSNSSQ